MTLQIDPGYSPLFSVNTGGVSNTLSFSAVSTSNSNGKMYIGSICNTSGGSGITGISGAGLTWTSRSILTVTGGFTEVWEADFAGALSAASFTVTYAAGTSYVVALAWAVTDSGNAALAFDGGGPQGSTSGGVSMTTQTATSIVIGWARNSSSNAPVVGAGWTAIKDGVLNSFCCAMFKTTSVTGTATVSESTGQADLASSIIDAVIISTGADILYSQAVM